MLRCSYKEADAELLLHAKHAADAGSKAVIIIAEDRDVLEASSQLGQTWGISPGLFENDSASLATCIQQQPVPARLMNFGISSFVAREE